MEQVRFFIGIKRPSFLCPIFAMWLFII
jgi:hypothetical protein